MDQRPRLWHFQRMQLMNKLVGEHRGGTDPIPLGYILPGLATYAISAYDTLTSQSPLAIKLGMLATADVASGAIWPLAWVIWLTTHFAGLRTPIASVFGF